MKDGLESTSPGVFRREPKHRACCSNGRNAGKRAWRNGEWRNVLLIRIVSFLGSLGVNVGFFTVFDFFNSGGWADFNKFNDGWGIKGGIDGDNIWRNLATCALV